MKAELEQRLRTVYPKGYLELIDIPECDFGAANALDDSIRAKLLGTGVDIDRWLFSPRERVITMTIRLQTGEWESWAELDDKDSSLHAWLKKARWPGIVFSLMISTVYPAWKVYYDPCGVRGNVTFEELRISLQDCVPEEEMPPAPWEKLLLRIHECCAAHGFVRLSQAAMHEEVPFVTESMWASEEERELLDLDENDFTPAPNQQVCNVAQCLFQQH